MFEAYCDRMGISLGSVRFLRHGERVFGASSPEALQVWRCGRVLRTTVAGLAAIRRRRACVQCRRVEAAGECQGPLDDIVAVAPLPPLLRLLPWP